MEYSYFMAMGESHAAIDCVIEAVRDLENAQVELMKRFNADGIKAFYDDVLQKYVIRGLIFVRADPPEGWHTTGLDGMAVMAWPETSSKDAFHIATAEGMLDRMARRTRLEAFFGCGDMPDKDMAAGEYLTTFLRQFSHVNQQPAGMRGRSLDKVSKISFSGEPVTVKDPLDWCLIGGNYYIRVPNDTAGKPVFTPPDAELVDYKDMLEIELDAVGRDWTSFRGPAHGR